MLKTVECRSCHRTADHRTDIPDGHPHGWYNLTVNVPPELGQRGKGYRWIGVFCSIGCLMAHEQILIEQAEEMHGLYDRD